VGDRRPRGYYERIGAPIALLGTMRDADLAARVGLTTDNVRYARKRRGIASRFNHVGLQPRLDYERIDRMLGTMSDSEVARAVGASTTSICARHVQLGLARFVERRRCACGREFLTRGGGLGKRRFCSSKCVAAGEYARKQGRNESLAVAIVALRRDLRGRKHG